MIKVYAHFDLRITALPQTGVSKHIHQMVTGLAKTDGFDVCLLASRDQVTSDFWLSKNSLPIFPVISLPIPHRASRLLWEHSDLGIVDRYCSSDGWVYCPMTLSVPVKKMRQACTFHGYPCFERGVPGYHSWSRRLLRYRSRLQAERAVKRCQLLLAVSDYAKNELIGLTGVDEKHVKVVGNGVESLFFEADKKSILPEPERPFFLTVGGLNVWDGGQHLLNAANELTNRLPDYQLLVAGNQHDPRYLKIAQELPNVKLLGYIPAQQLAQWMRKAQALWFLPNVESFGITALEAMAVGTPVISSGYTGVPGTVGDAAWMVDAVDACEVVDASMVLATNRELRTDYICRGRARAAQFTWQACVKRLVKALLEADS